MAIRFEEKGKDTVEPTRKARPPKTDTVPDDGGHQGAVAENAALPFAKPVKADKKRQRAKRS